MQPLPPPATLVSTRVKAVAKGLSGYIVPLTLVPGKGDNVVPVG